MPSYTVYLLRYRPTGEFLPQQMFRTSNKGATTWRPWEIAEHPPHNPLPRQFPTRKSAERCLAQLLRGYPEWQEIGPTLWDGPDSRLVWTKSPHHKIENFSIIKATVYHD